MIFVGIDPGKEGAIAVFNADTGEASAELTPFVRSPRARDEYDLVGIRDRLLELRMRASRLKLFVTVEKGQPMPPTVPGGSVANFARGVAHGWAWMLTALEIPYQLVAPRSWQAVMHAGAPGNDTKQRSILVAQRLFPSVRLTRSERASKPHDGIAEALLLAEYGRRTYLGLLARETPGCPPGEKRRRASPCPVCGRIYRRALVRATGIHEYPHVVVYQHPDGARCEDWRSTPSGIQPGTQLTSRKE